MRNGNGSDHLIYEKTFFDEHAGYADVEHKIAVKTALKMLMNGEPEEKILANTEIFCQRISSLKSKLC